MKFFLEYNKKLYSSHLFFFLFLLSLFIFPKIPLSPGGSSLNLALIVLFLWFIYYNIKFNYLFVRNNSALIFFLLFSIYSVFSSFLSYKPIAIFNALQFSLYTIFTSIIFTKYFSEIQKYNDSITFIQIVNIIGLTYSIGSIVSIFTGPIYPFQVGSTERIWGNVFIQQGVGFGVNQNGVGGLLVLFFIFCLFFVSSKYKPVYKVIYLLAIVSTISRSTYLCLVLGWVLYKIILYIYIYLKNKFTFNYKRFTLTLCVIIVVITPPILFLKNNTDYYEAIKIGFGLENQNNSLEQDRFNQWNKGIENFNKSGLIEKFIGKGYKNSSELIDGKYISFHNLYIQYLLDTGVIGIFLFFVSIGLFLVNITKKIFSDNTNQIYFFCLFSILSTLIHNITETFLYSIEYVTFLVLILNIYYFPGFIPYKNQQPVSIH